MPRLEDLTPAEERVLELLASGINNKEIAQRLEISEKTVRNHINHIFSKLSVQDRSEAIVLARDAGYGKRRG
jgi:DNA-binding NarL/FixJ family response regulator